ncbi:hypothetical protein [Streptomyces galbus]|jgi:hypothetical protein|uniref:Uncharacterized protein n=1 Tax=Streptomyces galbus TaxID=33898 RepID=A0A4U5W9P2_STRGB|nr:hypothetical protein [Streptomyces galbus]NKQ24952.1 hypothetical protein [Streptomyces galbus]TKS97450.1 hypothetical protein E4U92_32865 [Streptomyces galbus]GHD41907.1 hypothetical protein GCM10010335_44180 [Streptomyces galbus]
MASVEKTVEEVRIRDVDLEAVLDPAEADGVFRDSRECAALALIQGEGSLLLSPPTPRPKKR